MPCRARMRAIVLQGLLLLCFLKISIVCSIIEPGYLDFDNLPDTNFSCVGKVIGGYYADIEANCQMFHVCTIGQLDEPMDIRFLCLNGTVFDQETRVCERVDEVDCSKSEKFYHLNLELYGNTAPPIVEEAEVTEQSKSQSTSTTTPKTTTTRTTRAAFYTTPAPTLPPTTHSTPKVITSNQFPVSSGSDIRFNPEEINIRLTPGNPPIIKSSSVSYQQQAFNGGDPTITITTHTSVFKDKHGPITSSTQKPKAVVNYSLQHNSKPKYHPYDFMYQQTENSDVDYHTDLPSSEYASYESKDYHGDTEEKQVFNVPHTRRPEYSSTVFPSSIKPPHLLNYQRTEKPKPKTATDFPTLPPLTFSSPAPFSLTRHVDAKRSNDNQKRPRIIVSASASVSDASGRRLNYSLGTIGASHIIPKAPSSYDEYKETDVGLDPFYHDVPKVKSSRSKREAVTNNSDSQNKQSIVDIDKIWSPPDYVDDNYEPTVFNSTDNASLPVNTKDSDSVVIIHKEIVSHVEVHSNKSDHVETQSNSTSKDSLVGEQSATPWAPPEYVDDNYEAMTYRKPDNFLQDFNLTGKTDDNSYEDIEYEYYDYVDDNYERSMYESLDLENTTQNETDYLTNTEILTTETHTQPSLVDVTQETTLEVNTVTESIRQTEQTTKAKPYKPDVSKLINKIVDKEIVLDSREKYITPTNSEEVALRNLNTKGSDNISNSREKYTDFDINTTEITTTPLTQNNNTTQENKIGLVPSKTITNSVSEPDNKLNLLREETKSNLLSNLELPLKLSYETTSYPSLQSKLESNNVETLTSETTTAPSTTVSVLELTTMDTIQTTVGEIQDGISSVTVYPNLETTTESMDTTPYTTTQQSATDETTINVMEFTTMSLPEVQTSVLLNHPKKNETVTSPVPTVLYTSAQLSSKVGFTSNPDTTTDGKVREYTSAIKKSENSEDHESKINKDFTTTEAIATHTTTDGVVETTVVTSTTDFTTSISELDSTTMPTTISSTTRYSYLRTREPAYKRYARTRPTPGKHRFSSHNIHMSQSVLKLQSNLRNPPTTSTSTTTSPLQVKPIESDLPKSRRRQTSRRFSSNIRTKSAYSEDTLTESKEKVSFTTRPSLTKFLDEVPVTDAPLSKSANPTESKSDRGTLLPTTPLSQTLFVPRRFSYDVTRTFNCIGRKMNRFYPDPRDCRLFHYCTPGYTKTQVLDMKFVCDFGTYFDPDKLICTKVKPQRCK